MQFKNRAVTRDRNTWRDSETRQCTLRAGNTLRLSEKGFLGFLLSSSWKFPIFSFLVTSKKNAKCRKNTSARASRAQQSSKKLELRAVFGRSLEYSTGRYIQPNRAGCTTGASIAIPPKKKLRMEKQKATFQQRIDSYMSSIYLGRMRASGQCEGGTSEQGLFKRYKVKSRKQKMESRSKLRKKAIRSRSNSHFLSERNIKSVRPFLNLAFTQTCIIIHASNTVNYA